MIQPLAYIHPQAKIADNVVIEPFVTIHKDVEIGEGTWIGSNSVIMDGARIGKNCRIFPGAVVSAPPQDLKYKGEQSTVSIGDNTTIRECVTLNRGTALDKNTTTIGSNCLLMAYVHVAHDCVIGDNVIVANAVQLAGHITVYDYAFIGGSSAVHQFVEIGAHSMISGGSLVRKDVPPFTKAGREPLSYVGINSVGLRRRGFSAATIAEIQEIYRIIFLKKYNVTKALDIIEAEFTPSVERDEIINFLQNSQRGIMKGFGNT
ncbi:acyl-ACP--UDP-N-acetylglucosamine O-acyltransferase [Mucilaginibacter sp. cycad4]|jgi:UDP-N-acetylglucosamine acyltransferase|uniref:Acyl-ACP--UDP-N-acetylglucosamine O-acyltransferase n=1 Tax=Mucilaginibacter angelicae TaxID=869718 RepID=A0ABV6LG55_9SPHI|nr:acyl-ACP--UDP-N-acetylglucosamine O-acyltransferase [Mucilaginibacter gossypii]WPU98984.1 acyl-ACP--UDP-N-acetylglucosamine O-acyltransferase [Mucilaginibacter gossypii]